MAQMKTALPVAALCLLLGACGAKTPEDSAPADPASAASTTPADAPASAPADTAPAAPAIATPTDGKPADSAPAGSTPTAVDPAARQAVDNAIDSQLGDHTRYAAVIEELQSAVAADDGARVAALAEYPFKVHIGGKPVTLKDAKAFAARYSEFMTPEIRSAIVDTTYDKLFVNYKGVMFGNGQAWINGICKDKACAEFDVKLVTLQSAQ